MIRINRSPCPAVLRGAGTDSDRYRHPDVVRELWKMQHKKCCYCERDIPETGHDKAVEHFAPKSVFKTRRNRWSNLLLACSQCNGKKSNKFPVMLTKNTREEKVLYVKKARNNRPALIDPSGKINPEAHLDYHLEMQDGSLAGQICPRDGSVHGKMTISVTGIGDSFILKCRRQHFRTLCLALINLDEAVDTGDEDCIKVALDRFKNLLSSGSKFAGLAREFARKMKLDANYGLTIPGLH